MNCNIFKKRLEDYVLGNVSNDLKIALESHMEQCESCRMIHEEEFKTDTDFKMVLSIDGIQFNSSRTSIIDAIDKNRYSKKTSNKILYTFKRHKNKYLSYAVAAIAMIVFIPMLLKGISGGNYKSENATNNTAALYKSSEEKKEDVAIAESNNQDNAEIGKENIIENPESKKEASNETTPLMEFKSSMVTEKELPNYDLVWETSVDGENSAAIDISEERDDSFGLHVIYIKNIKTNEIAKHEIVNNEKQYTPRNIEWWDNEHLIFVTGYAYGTASNGSNVNSLDISTGIFSALYKMKDDKNQILEIEKVKNDLILELIIYDDDNYNTSHKAVGKMTPVRLDEPVDMQIVSEEEK